MLKRIESAEEIKEIKVGDLLQVTNSVIPSFNDIAIVIRISASGQRILYNVTNPKIRSFLNSINFNCWSRLLSNAKTNKNN